MKDLDICGLGSAIVDLFVDVSEQDFEKLGYRKSSMELVSVEEQAPLLNLLGTKEPVMASGGSVANSIIAASQLGGKTALCCSMADDRYGRFFLKECRELGLIVPCEMEAEGSTAVCISLVTPDAERTMRTSLGVSGLFAARHIDPDAIARSSWMFIEGYMFANGAGANAAIDYAVNHAQSNKTKIAVTCSEAWVVSAFGEALENVLSCADLVFCNAQEAQALTGDSDLKSAGRKLSKRIPNVVITAGPDGAYLWWSGEEAHVPAFQVDPRDLTGAGDMFAGCYLYGLTHGYTPPEAALRGCYLSKLVISQVGARLHSGVKEAWNTAGKA